MDSTTTKTTHSPLEEKVRQAVAALVLTGSFLETGTRNQRPLPDVSVPIPYGNVTVHYGSTSGTWFLMFDGDGHEFARVADTDLQRATDDFVVKVTRVIHGPEA